MQPCDTIGSHLCERLLAEGNDIICIDNYFTGHKSNIRHLLSPPNFEIIRHDIVYPYMAEIEEIYGDPLIHPQREDYWGHVNPLGIRSCYDEGKRCAETLFTDYHRQHGVPIRIARIFNTFGPRMHPNDGRVVSNFILQALQDKPITIYGDGSQTRSFCYVDDMVDGLTALMHAPDDAHLPVNLGNPEERTILNLAEIIIEFVNSRSTIDFRPLPQDDPRRRRPDIAQAREKLGWEPKVSMEEGLRKTVEYFEGLLRSRREEGAEV